MDASQISIKMNQTPQQSGVKTKGTAQSNSSECSFDQIFAMIYSIRQSGNSNGEIETLAAGNDDSGLQGFTETATDVLSPEDKEKLEAILTSLLVAMQQSPQTMGQLQNQSLLQAVSGVVGSFSEGNDSIGHVIQMGAGTKQSKLLDPKQLLDQLKELLNEITTNDDQNLSEIKPNIKNELQKIIDSIQNKNEQLSTGDGKVKQPIISIPTELILDKNQVILSNIKEPTGKYSRAVSRPVTHLEIQMKTDGQTPVAFPIVQGQEGISDSQSVQASPAIPVSEFAPEVSELIGRYLKITNGESGSTEAKLSLYPEHLGPVEVKIVTQQGHVSAQILTNTSIAKDALEGQLQHLRDALQQQGIIVQKLDVSQQPSMQTGSNQPNLTSFQNGSNSPSEHRNHPAPEETRKSSSNNQNELERDIVQATYGSSTIKKSSSIDFNA